MKKIMRAPFQVLAIPCKVAEGSILYCVFHRSDLGQWQFIAGGGEDDESPIQAIKREISEESGVFADKIIELKSICYIPANIFQNALQLDWRNNQMIILITGASHTGKTALAQKLLEKYKILLLSYEQ